MSSTDAKTPFRLPDPSELKGRHAGVPDGFFDSYGERLASRLPEQPWETGKSSRPSLWQVVRPYLYMAAAFAGVWCMMSIFDRTRPANAVADTDNPVLVAALSDDRFVYDYFMDATDDGTAYADDYDYTYIPEAEFEP